MRRYGILFVSLIIVACHNKSRHATKTDNKELAKVLEEYYNRRMELFPLEATQNGVSAYNDKMPATFTDSHRASVKIFYNKTLSDLHRFNRSELNENDRISYDFLEYYLTHLLKDFSFKYNFIPTDQMWGQQNSIGQWGSGEGAQPFNTVKDYENWLGRLHDFTGWLDSAIVYFKRGMDAHYTLPKPLVRSMIPEFGFMITKDAASNLFYGPVKNMPSSFSDADRARLTKSYATMIMDTLVPAYRRMTDFLKNEYLPAARTSTTGINALSDGSERYKLMVQIQTTTDKTPDEIRETGYKEVRRIRQEMEKIKAAVGFSGTLEAFFDHVRKDPQFMPFKTPDEVLSAFRGIQSKIVPNLTKYFKTFPKTPFEIRRTEAFRENSATAEYNQSPDGIKAAIFYIPIPDAANFNITSGMQSLFLHEAIPGHHYQISLQAENKSLPSFRRHNELNNAYVEGWALYCESLGSNLGLYTDPYQHLGALGDEMHRAIRLVVDVSLHTGSMNREQAIKYMMDNEAINVQGATAEIERYISGPAQALSYKTGAMKIAELRDKYSQLLGSKFSIADFHDELLKDGSMPLTVLENKMDRWAASVKNN